MLNGIILDINKVPLTNDDHTLIKRTAILFHEYLFIFKNPNMEIFAENLADARKKSDRLGISAGEVVFVTENFDCPKCGPNTNECNYLI